MRVLVPSGTKNIEIEGEVVKVIQSKSGKPSRYIVDIQDKDGSYEVEVPIHMCSPVGGFSQELAHWLLFAGLQPMQTKEDL
mgnify:FL=1|tara:strand:- start:666 stop:908 length:243 start_codon:yes stop_codon:yes gene_type:complete